MPDPEPGGSLPDVPDIEQTPVAGAGVRRFSTFFAAYLLAVTSITAVMPLFLTDKLPTYHGLRGVLEVGTTLACVYAFSLIYYHRIKLGRAMFGSSGGGPGHPAGDRSSGRHATQHGPGSAFVDVLPALFALLSLGCLVGYVMLVQSTHKAMGGGNIDVSMLYSEAQEIELDRVEDSVRAAPVAVRDSVQARNDSVRKLLVRDVHSEIVAHQKVDSSFASGRIRSFDPYDTDLPRIPLVWAQLLLYAGIWVFAVAALGFMATREYLQHVLGLRDHTLLRR